MRSQAGCAFDSGVTLIFHLFMPLLPCTACLPSLVLTARIVFRLKSGHTDRHVYKVTDTTDHHTTALVLPTWLTDVFSDACGMNASFG